MASPGFGDAEDNSGAEFFNLTTTDILVFMILCGGGQGGLSVHYWIFSSISDFYPLDARCTLSVVTMKKIYIYCQLLLGGKQGDLV